MEYILPESIANLSGFLKLANTHSVAVHHHFRHLYQTFWHLLWHVHPHFYPVGILLETHCFEMLFIVWIMIGSRHRTELVKSFNEQTLWVHVREAQRTLNLSHATFLTPSRHGINQSLAHFQIINEIHPTKAHGFDIPRLVCLSINDGNHTSHHLTIANRDKRLEFRELCGCILV